MEKAEVAYGMVSQPRRKRSSLCSPTLTESLTSNLMDDDNHKLG